jgi:hypothetical protein
MEMSKKPENKALSVPERAVLALGYNAAATTALTELAAKNAHIDTITNDDGRKQADRARLDLRAARLKIKNAGLSAREDATAYSKAVIAEETRLIALVEPEEDRLAALVDAFDAKVAAEKQAKIDAEQKRVEDLTARIATIRGLTNIPFDASPVYITDTIGDLEAIAVDETFEEYEQQASDAKTAALVKLREAHASAVAREAAAEQARKDQAELARLREEAAARKKADDEAAERERHRQADEADAKLRADNQGHGHVRPRPDGARARCGGPGICNECSREKAALAEFRKPAEPAPTNLTATEVSERLQQSPPPCFRPIDTDADLARLTSSADVTSTVAAALAPPPPRPPPSLAEIVALLMFQYDADEATVLNWLDAAVRGTRRAA